MEAWGILHSLGSALKHMSPDFCVSVPSSALERVQEPQLQLSHLVEDPRVRSPRGSGALTLPIASLL